jgi:hypothetical protein
VARDPSGSRLQATRANTLAGLAATGGTAGGASGTEMPLRVTVAAERRLAEHGAMEQE